MMLGIIDTHTHLDEIEHIPDVIQRAERAGVSAIITMGQDIGSGRRNLEIAGKQGNLTIYSALGVHPWNVKDCPVKKALTFVEDNIGKAVAVGEIGLDYWIKAARKDIAEKERQRSVFKSLLELGVKYEKPVSIHTRGAWADAFRLTAETGVTKAVFHWYSGPLEILDKILDKGYFISATPAAQYSKNHQAVIARAPLDRILLETDSPVKYQGSVTEPADVFISAEAVARIKKITRDEVVITTTRNALVLFDLGADYSPRLRRIY